MIPFFSIILRKRSINKYKVQYNDAVILKTFQDIAGSNEFGMNLEKSVYTGNVLNDEYMLTKKISVDWVKNFPRYYAKGNIERIDNNNSFIYAKIDIVNRRQLYLAILIIPVALILFGIKNGDSPIIYSGIICGLFFDLGYSIVWRIALKKAYKHFEEYIINRIRNQEVFPQ